MIVKAGEEEQRLLEDNPDHQHEKAANPVNAPDGHIASEALANRHAQDVVYREKVDWRDIPHKKQLLLLALCRLSTPLSNACLLPYIYYLVKSILSDPDHPPEPQQISRLTGLLVSAYPLGQMSTSIVWGRLSDTHGRKPAILLGLSISVIANLAFGFSKTIAMLFFWRVLAGMANGILGVMRTMTAEIVKERKYQTRAFLALPLIFNSGRVVALAIGGCLANPVENIPALFGSSGIFNVHKNRDGVAWTLKYPYALPALFNGAVLLVCLLLAVLCMKESLPSKENDWDPGLVFGKVIYRLITGGTTLKQSAEYTPLRTEEDAEGSLESDLSIRQTTPKSANPSPVTQHNQKCKRLSLRSIWTRSLLKTLVAFGLLPLHNSTFLHIFPVFLSMPPSANNDYTLFRFTGGMGLASPTVGLYLATFGICGILLQLFIYPRAQAYIGNLGIFRIANSVFPLAYAIAPYLSLVSGNKTARWITMAVVLFLQVFSRTMAIPSSVILLTEAAPQRGVLGTVHGAGSTLSALSSAIGPIIGGLILGRGIEIEVIGLVWWSWLSLVGFAALAWSFVLDKGQEDEETTESAQKE